MGRWNRERIARILAGEETPISAKIKDKIKDVGVSAIQSQSTPSQVAFLADSLHSGRLTPTSLKKALVGNAHKEMRKGADKLIKKGKTPTVELLLDEYRKDAGFRRLAAEVGLDESWFTRLAESECQRQQKERIA